MVEVKERAISRREILLVSSLARQQRLLRSALQSERVLKAFYLIIRSQKLDFISKRFDLWKSFVRSAREATKDVVVIRNKAGKAVLTIQKAARKHLGRKKENPITYVKTPEVSAQMIQRLFRGYMARGDIILRERNKLLKFLRSWSRNHTENLFHISSLQQVEAQALIQSAVNLTIIPSRPVRDLPSMAQIKSYRAGLYALYWQLHYRAAFKKEERKAERQRRREMYYEDLNSKIRESREVAQIEAEKQRQKDLADYLQTEQEETEKRKVYESTLLILEMNNKKAAVMRENKEKSWREAERQKAEEIVEKKSVLKLLEREWELMIYEEGRSRESSRLMNAEIVHEQEIIVEAEKVLSARRKVWDNMHTIYRKGKPTDLTKAILLNKLRIKHDVLYKQWVDYVNALPLSQEVRDILVTEALTDAKENLLQDDLDHVLSQYKLSYRALSAYLSILYPPKEPARLKKRKMMDFFRFASQFNYHPWQNLLSIYPQNKPLLNYTVFQHISGISHKIQLTWKSNDETIQCKNMNLSFKLAHDPTSLLLLEKVLQYQYLRKEYTNLHRDIIIVSSRFRLELQQVNDLRNKVKEERMLRSERQSTLNQASLLEKSLQQIRSDLIAKCTRIYHIMYHIMKMCLELFCFKPEGNNYLDLLAAEIKRAPSVGNLNQPSVKLKVAASSSKSPEKPADSVLKTQKKPTRISAVVGLLTSSHRTKSSKAQTFRSHINERSYDIYSADHELYWQQLAFLVNSQSDSFTVSAVEMTSWPVPPKVRHLDDGTRHIIKDVCSKKRSSVKLKYSVYAKSKSILDYISKKTPVVKSECKFFDIPGLNAFINNDSRQYDFILWSEDVLKWSYQCFQYVERKENQWKTDKSIGVYMILQRLRYLSTVYAVTLNNYANTDPSSVFHFQSPESSSEGRQIMKQIAESSAGDVYELLLCSSQLLVERIDAESDKLEVKNTLIKSEELDRVCGKHPGSLYSYLHMLSEIAIEKTPSWNSVFPSRTELLKIHRNTLLSSLLDVQKDGIIPSYMILNIIDKEMIELQELSRSLKEFNCLSLTPNYDNVYVNPENPTETIGNITYNIVLKPQKLPVRVIEGQSSTNNLYFKFPTYMYPVLYVGKTAPKESFYKLYMREQAQGVVGDYTVFQRKDNQINKLAKRLVCHLHKRSVIVKYMNTNVKEYMTLEKRREQMIYEDARSFLVQRYDQVQKQQQKKSGLQLFFDGMMGCIMPKRKHAQVFAMQYNQGQCNLSLKIVQQYHNKAMQSRRFVQMKSTLQSQLQNFLRKIISSNYDFYTKSIMETMKSVEAFRYVDIQALNQQLSMLNKQYLGSNFRRMSWTTGEKVYVNDQGDLLDPTVAVFPKLPDMSNLYKNMRMDSASSLGCVEMMLGGGLESQYLVLRIVEDEQINVRSSVIFEQITPATFSTYVQGYFPNYRKLYDSNKEVIDYGLAMRSFFAYYPVCACCLTRPANNLTSKGKFVCSKFDCTHTNQVPVIPLHEQQDIMEKFLSVLMTARYGEAMQTYGRNLIKFQAIVRGRLVRKKSRAKVVHRK